MTDLQRSLIEETYEIDEWLAYMEDYLHGEEGDGCTETRKKLSRLRHRIATAIFAPTADEITPPDHDS